MILRFTRDTETTYGRINAGDVFDVPEDEAFGIVQTGRAVPEAEPLSPSLELATPNDSGNERRCFQLVRR